MAESGMAEWWNWGMADGMAEWQKEWQNGQMAGMATYVLFMVHTDDTNTDTDTTLIFYSIDHRKSNHNPHHTRVKISS
jgi:hypothetical protein